MHRPSDMRSAAEVRAGRCNPDQGPAGPSRRARPGRTLVLRAPLLLMALLVGMLPLAAAAAPRHAAMAIDLNTGHILHNHAGDELRYPASLTKMMTLYLVFERLETGQLQSGDRIGISPNAADTPPSRLGLKPGSTISVADAIRSLVTKSANDVAVAIAEHIAGSEVAFARLMTAKAIELGMSRTTFRNPHGLPDDEQQTTARDMILLAMRLYDHFPRHIGVFATRTFHHHGKTYRNHNTMLRSYRGMEGIKTGYTRQSGFNLVASVRRDGKHVIAVVFGGNSAAARNARMRVILDRALAQASRQRTREPNVASFRRARARIATRQPPPAPRRAVPSAPPAEGWPTSIRFAARPGNGTSVAAATAPPAAAAPETFTRPSGRTVTVARVRPVDVLAGRERAPEPSGLARQPSTLNAQHAALRESIMPTGPRLAPAPPAAPAPGMSGDLEIQIGAFATEDEARQHLEMARQRAASIVAAAGTATPSVVVDGRRYYRARFTGFESAQATEACNALRRLQLDCFVSRGN